MCDRKRLRLRHHDYGSAGAYFVTVVTRGRHCVFGEVVDEGVRLSVAGRAAATSWSRIPSHHAAFGVDAFVVMPNHVHGILFKADAPSRGIPVPAVVGSFKGRVSRIVGRPVWQRGYHDRVIRDEEELEAIRDYIATNPLRWALDHENPDCHPIPWAGPVRPTLAPKRHHPRHGLVGAGPVRPAPCGNRNASPGV